MPRNPKITLAEKDESGKPALVTASST
jgi:hypothetical protein